MAKEDNNPKTSAEVLMLAYLCVKDAQNLQQKVDILDRFGLADRDIVAVCRCGLQAVRNARQANKKKG